MKFTVRFIIRALLSLLVVLVLFSAVFLLWRHELGPMQADSKELISFRIEKGESSASIAERLQKASLIRSGLFFRLYLRLTKQGLQAGDYSLNQKMSLPEIVDKFQHGAFNVKLTIPEGLRKEEIARLVSLKLEARNSKLATEFLEQVKNDQPQFESLKDKPTAADLEGFLFPDTYLLPEDIDTHDLINLFLANFDRKFDAKLREDLKKQRLTIFEAVTLASIVEREAKFEKDRPLIAGILIKRLRNSWPLEADATVQYAVADLEDRQQGTEGGKETVWWKDNLTEANLKVDSPYNTRKYQGLPPGPISNPGLDSLKAVVYPQDSLDWFYFSRKSGETVYSKTLEEHLVKLNLDGTSQ